MYARTPKSSTRLPSKTTCSTTNAALINCTSAGTSASLAGRMRTFDSDEGELEDAAIKRVQHLRREKRTSGKFGRRAQFFLDAQQLVVLGDAVRPRSRPRFNLSRRRGYRQIRDERVFRLARTVRND